MGENVARSLGTFQSGSPPAEDFGELSRVATVDRREPEGPVFQSSIRRPILSRHFAAEPVLAPSS